MQNYEWADEAETNEELKARLPPGVWQDEPDKLVWRSKEHSLPMMIVRSPSTGALCGYVGVPPGHRFHKADYSEVDDVEVHGGLTYANECSGHICHKHKDSEPEVWWLGFDCAHSGDYTPLMPPYLGLSLFGEDTTLGGGDDYCTVAYVKAETERLAAQLASAS